MQEFDDAEIESNGENTRPLDRKKLLIFILPVVIVVGLSAGLFYVFNSGYKSNTGTYSVVKKNGAEKGSDAVTVFYDLPEITTALKNDGVSGKSRLHIRINLEIERVEDVATIEVLTPKIIDAVIAHTIELTPQEVSGSGGLYWLKEELLYRINLITNPIKVSNLNFRTFEVSDAGSDKK